ncbi:MAG TPA: chorismate mutase [Candidatus Saccharimonadales bacterium]|jgi:chorismate mutase/prephenate dehydratase|nr:chorismate mutase [Candidatus Saccharimonadales bacterium]
MSDEKKIAQLRVEIDGIDTKLVDMLNERARLALAIGIAKNGKNIVRPAREETVMRNVAKANKGPLADEGLYEIFKKIIAVCRQIQYNKEP